MRSFKELLLPWGIILIAFYLYHLSWKINDHVSWFDLIIVYLGFKSLQNLNRVLDSSQRRWQKLEIMGNKTLTVNLLEFRFISSQTYFFYLMLLLFYFLLGEMSCKHNIDKLSPYKVFIGKRTPLSSRASYFVFLSFGAGRLVYRWVLSKTENTSHKHLPVDECIERKSQQEMCQKPKHWTERS